MSTRIMRHPQVAIASDSGVLAFGEGVPHPRGYGNNARVLGEYVRSAHVITLEEAIRKMTSLPAEHFRFPNRGAIKAGYAADVVVFDASRVEDTASFEQPHAYPTGMPYVLVNGVPVVDGGEQTDAPARAGAREVADRRGSQAVERSVSPPPQSRRRRAARAGSGRRERDPRKGSPAAVSGQVRGFQRAQPSAAGEDDHPRSRRESTRLPTRSARRAGRPRMQSRARART